MKMNSELETCIKKNVPWSKLPSNIKQLAFNSQKEYDKCVINYSIKNQLRFRGNLIRHVRKDEQKYYEELLNYSQSSLLLYPYHLSDVIVKGMRVTPFQYYTKVLETIMDNERSYDSLPNFTAADCLRLLGIGRNEYIDLMNQCRSGRKLFRRKSVRDLLPSKPVNIHIEPWWIADTGFITEEDVKLISQAEKDLIDHIIDCGKQRAGEIDYNLVHSLYKKGLVFLEVPIESTDFIVVPPLEGFVMNRVLGDDFETLLYKIFVSIDEHTSVGELASVLQIELQAVKQAVSLYCRLGFARKKVPESEQWHPSWNPAQSKTVLSPSTEMMPSFSKVYSDLSAAQEDEPGDPCKKTKIAFLFDSTLTAFLMMGNLSPGLKSHAVTMFEVGKLTEESMESFLSELEKVSTARDDSEGEARRYFEHALVLRATILALRHRGLDLVRCESLQSLDQETCSRLLTKNYGLLISMAPLSGELTPITTNCLPHLGPPCPQAHTPWFKLFLYHITGSGPPSLLLSKGTRVNRVPKFLKGCDRVLVTSWGHDPAVVPISNLLFSLNDALCYSPVLVQVYGTNQNVGDTRLVPFPFFEDESGTNIWRQHPAIIRLSENVDLVHSCGYVTMVQVKSPNVPNVSSLPTPPTKDKLTLSFLSRSQPQLQPLDTPATPSTVEAWIETMEDGNINVKRYPPSPVKEEDGDPINGITSEECAEILENELDGLDSDQSNSPFRTAEPAEDLACSIPLSMSLAERKPSSSTIVPTEWSLLDCCFGVPLFDADVNRIICRSIVDKLSHNDSLQALTYSNETLSKSIVAFISQVHSWRLDRQFSEPSQTTKNENHWPTLSIMFKNGQLSPWDDK